MKKGYFYFIEIILIILIVTLIWISFPESVQSVGHLSEQENLRQQGFQVLRSLDENYLLTTNSSNLSANTVDYNTMRLDIRHSFPQTVEMRIEYIVNDTFCRSEYGQINPCGVNTTPANLDVVTTQYTVTKQFTPYTVKLYLWRTLSGLE